MNRTPCGDKPESDEAASREACVATLDEIDQWACSTEGPSVGWLNGLAGTGKSTIALLMENEPQNNDKRPGAYFFCSREPKLCSSNPKDILPALGLQLAYKHPTTFGLAYIRSILSNQRILKSTPPEQMEELIVKPLIASDIRTLIMIDGLDECKDEDTVSAILSAIVKFSPQIPKVKFLITSRPKRHIRKGFRGLPQGPAIFDPCKRNQDGVRKYLEKRIEEHLRFQPHWLRESKVRWLSPEKLDDLCKHAEGQILYANAMVEFMFNCGLDPEDALSGLLTSPEKCVCAVEVGKRTTIPSIYTTALLEDVGSCDHENSEKIRSVLGAVALATYPISPSTIATLLGLHVKTVHRYLESIQSLLIFQEDIEVPVEPVHKFFLTFLIDQKMCPDMFYVSPATHHRALLIGCLKLMNERLSSETDLHTDGALKYACMSWHHHLVGTGPTGNVPEVAQLLDPFLDKRSTWEHVLSVCDVSEDGRRHLKEWLKTVSSILPFQHQSQYSPPRN